MGPSLLIIKQLSATGQVIRTIECPAGQITVLRAQAVSDLKPYQRALAGLSGGERFIVTVDSDPYEAYNHDLIGFGEQFKSGSYSVSDYLADNKIEIEEIRPSLVAFSLEERLQTPCSSLSHQEARLLRIVAAIYSRGKILVLNDPFEPLSGQWKERCAELIVHHAKMSGRVVIVTALSSRPECWIDNELIVRTQVGETRQKTIGFSSAPSEIKEALEQLRGEIALEKNNPRPGAAPTLAAGALIASNPISYSTSATTAQKAVHKTFWQKSYKILTTPLPVSPMTVFFSLVLVTSGVVYRGYKEVTKESEREQQIALLTEQVHAIVSPQTTESSINEHVGSAAALPTTPEYQGQTTEQSPEQVEVLEPPPSDLLLDLYPESIKLSVIHAFEGKNIDFPMDTDESPAVEKVTKVARNAPSDLLKMLESASGTGNRANSGQNGEESNKTYTENIQHAQSGQETEDGQSWEQRRETMRRKFLESIQAASGD